MSGRGRRRRRAYIADESHLLITLDDSPGPSTDNDEAEDPEPAEPHVSDNEEVESEPDADADAAAQPSTKRKKVEGDGAHDQVNEAAAAQVDDDGDEGRTCSICFDEYTNAGAHRLVCLACGHLFGKSCIERWLKAEKVSKCPNCKKKARVKDIRQIYGRAVQMSDTTELEQIREVNCALRSENDCLKLELARNRLKAQKEKEALENELSAIKSASAVQAPSVGQCLTQTRTAASPPSVSQALSLVYRSSTEMSREDSCRAMSFCSYSTSLVVTVQNQQSIFKPFGFKTVDMSSGRPVSYIPVHENRPRDCAFSPSGDGLVLSTGEDKTLCITCTRSNTIVKRLALPANGWSCCWQSGQPYVYAGLSNGQVLMFDTRMGDSDASEPIKDVTGSVNRVPVSTLHWMDQASLNGLLVTDLKQCTFYDVSPSTSLSPHVLIADEGQITSMCYDKSSSQFAATFRPGSIHRTVTHKLYRLAAVDDNVQASVVQTWPMRSTTQTFMTRNVLFSDPNAGQTLGVAFDETNSTVRLFDWSTAREQCVLRLPNNDKDVVGMAHIAPQNSSRRSIAVLTQKKLHCLDICST